MDIIQLKGLDELKEMPKEGRKAYAKWQTEVFDARYKGCIASSVKLSKIYSGNTQFPPLRKGTPDIEVIDTDTVSALFDARLHNQSVCVLNFASYNYPGGGFVNGAMAQEEALCYTSTLYNVLSHFQSYYEWNREHKNRGIQDDRAIYSPEVIFFHNGECRTASVLTCAAPKRNLLLRYNAFTEEENTQALISRILFMRKICDSNPCDVLILGAWGCGVFKQNPEVIAQLFRAGFTDAPVKKVIYAIPGGLNLEVFRKVIVTK